MGVGGWGCGLCGCVVCVVCVCVCERVCVRCVCDVCVCECVLCAVCVSSQHVHTHGGAAIGTPAARWRPPPPDSAPRLRQVGLDLYVELLALLHDGLHLFFGDVGGGWLTGG
jgi:hypothetical protein